MTKRKDQLHRKKGEGSKRKGGKNWEFEISSIFTGSIVDDSGPNLSDSITILQLFQFWDVCNFDKCLRWLSFRWFHFGKNHFGDSFDESLQFFSWVFLSMFFEVLCFLHAFIKILTFIYQNTYIHTYLLPIHN